MQYKKECVVFISWCRKKLKCEELQKEYEFEIPRYILTELISTSYNKLDVCLLVNMAVINHRFTDEEGNILKNKYCFN